VSDGEPKRWTREEWEQVLAERTRADAARPRLVAAGARVELELVDERGAAERLNLVIVPDDQADLARGYLGAGTPLAQAILGKPAGAAVAYRRADVVEIRILAVEPAGAGPPDDQSSARQAILQKAVDRSELAETLRLALTVDVKWGPYDPDGIAPAEPSSGEAPPAP
jgi:hypothetical protein